jgi:Rax2 C-terminal beta propeller domain/Siphovirus-type tail component, C-terminal domain
MIRRYAKLPDIVSGAELLGENWSVIVPVARTNLILNGSFELGITGISAVGGASAIRSATNQYHGAYSMIIFPGAGVNDGVYYDPITLTSGTTYAFSLKLFCPTAGIPYKMYFASSAGAELAVQRFRGTGRWQWIWIYFTPTSTTTYRLYLTKDNSSNAASFWTDGWQCEAIAAGETVSTYIDGDQQGLVPNQSPPAYWWNGAPFASTSGRSGLTRAGGMVVRFKDYFTLTQILSLGLAGVLNVSTEYARLDGGADDYTRKPTRQFSLVGRFNGRSYPQLLADRGDLAKLLDRDVVGLDQQLVLLRTLEDGRGNVIAPTARIACKYAGGLEGNTDNQVAESAAISFIQYMPFVQADGEDGGTLSVQQTVTNANYILKRSPSGTWSALGTGITGTQIDTILRAGNGDIYAGGIFTDAGGSGADNIARWDGSAWSVLASATAINAEVRTLALAPNGTTIYVGGDFTNANGIAAADFIASWDSSSSTWAALSTGANGAVVALAVAPNGDLYAGGVFTDIGGSGADFIAKWDGVAWSVLGSATAINASVNAIAIRGTKVYIGGSFTNAGGVAAADNIAVWDTVTSTWGALSTGVDAAVQAQGLTFDDAGYLYAVGAITNAGGVAVNGIARWNGTAWEPLGSGIAGTGGLRVARDPQGKILASAGSSTVFGGITMPDRIARWTGASWIPIDVDLPGAGTIVRAITPTADGSLYLGFDANGSATAAGITTITNDGTAKAYPTIRLTAVATSRIYQIVNTTTGRAIYLNYTMNNGEVATLNLQPDGLSFISTFQGNIANTIMPGSNEADFFLAPGDNIISVFTSVSTVVAALYWRPAYADLANVR